MTRREESTIIRTNKRKYEDVIEGAQNHLYSIGMDTLKHVFSFLEEDTLVICTFVCKLWNEILSARIFVGHQMGHHFIKNASDSLVKWLRENHCPLTPHVMFESAKYGQIKGLEWATEDVSVECTHESAFYNAALNKSYTSLMWFIRRGMELPDGYRRNLREEGCRYILYWIDRETDIYKNPGRISSLPTGEEYLESEMLDLDQWISRTDISVVDRFSLLEECDEKFGRWTREPNNELVSLFCEMLMILGDKDSLSWLRKNGFLFNHDNCLLPMSERRRQTVNWIANSLGEAEVFIDDEMMGIFAKNGRLKVIKKATAWIANGDFITITMEEALRGDQIEVVRHLNESFDYDKYNVPIKSNVLRKDQKILDYIVEKKMCKWCRAICRLAIKHDNLQVFQKVCSLLGWRREEFIWTIARHGRISFLESIDQSHYNEGEFFDDVQETAACHFQFEFMKWAKEKGYPYGVSSTLAAVKANNFPMLKWLIESGCKWDKDLCVAALEMGNIQMYKYIMEKGGKLGKFGERIRKERGEQYVCQLAFTKNWSFRDKDIENAVANGNFKMAKWALENKYDFTFKHIKRAMLRPTSDMALLLLEGTEKWSMSTIKYATIRNKPRVLRWVSQQDSWIVK